MRINHIQQAYGLEIQKAAGKSKDSVKSSKGVKGDSVSFSKQAKDLNKVSGEQSAASQRIGNLPEIREEKVREVKQKLADGYYDTPEFVDRLADRLMKDFGLTDS